MLQLLYEPYLHFRAYKQVNEFLAACSREVLCCRFQTRFVGSHFAEGCEDNCRSEPGAHKLSMTKKQSPQAC